MKKGIEIFSLKGKTILLTGATGHLGSEMAFAFAEAGARVLINSRNMERSQFLVSTLRDKGYLADEAVFDVTSKLEIEAFADKIKERPIHTIVNNAYVGRGGDIKSSIDESYTETYDITVVSAHRILKAMLPNLRLAVQQTGDASLINMATMYALVSPDQSIYESSLEINPPFYGSAKAGLLQWTRYAACEFGKEGIRVNSISPGPFPSLKVQAANPEFIRSLANKVPLRRIGSSQEIRGPVLFLASSASSFVNGANVVVDGGWTIW